MLSVDAVKYIFFIDVSTSFKGKETAVKPNKMFFFLRDLLSNKSLKFSLLVASGLFSASNQLCI